MMISNKDMDIIIGMVKNAEANIAEKTGIKIVLTAHFPDQDYMQELETMFDSMCQCWGVDLLWVSKRDRGERRPIMRKLLWMAGKKRYPNVSNAGLARLTGIRHHATVIRGIKDCGNWLATGDAKTLSYYEPVKQFFNEQKV